MPTLKFHRYVRDLLRKIHNFVLKLDFFCIDLYFIYSLVAQPPLNYAALPISHTPSPSTPSTSVQQTFSSFNKYDLYYGNVIFID